MRTSVLEHVRTIVCVRARVRFLRIKVCTYLCTGMRQARSMTSVRACVHLFMQYGACVGVYERACH